jgi:two-component system, OmpR family, phosphate regulon response regulator PhoB
MSKKVLIVEDDMALFNMYSVELKIKGYDVLNVNDGLQALPKARDYQPNIILLDIMLPGMNGLNILTELKSDPQTSEIPVVMLTNYGSEDNVKKALESGATDYIMKYKILPSELSERIEVVLGTSSASDVKIAG